MMNVGDRGAGALARAITDEIVHALAPFITATAGLEAG